MQTVGHQIGNSRKLAMIGKNVKEKELRAYSVDRAAAGSNMIYVGPIVGRTDIQTDGHNLFRFVAKTTFIVRKK